MSDKEKLSLLTAPELTEERVLPSVFGITSEASDKYKSRLAELLINPDKPEPEPETLLTLQGTPILWRGCKSFICAVAKARKTTTLTLFAAILCGRDETSNGFRAYPGCRVLYIDTEQARTDSQRILFRTAKLCNKAPGELRMQVLSLNKEDPETIRGIMEVAITEYSPDVVILDNWTDCVTSVMDDAACTDFSRQLRMLAETYNIGLFSVIHANESTRNDDKPNFRGWGAEEARKSDLTLFLKDMGDYSKATFGRCRGKRPEGFCVSIDVEGLPYLYTETQVIPPTANVDRYADIVKNIPQNGLTSGELGDIIRKHLKVKARSAVDEHRKAMLGLELISKAHGRYYKYSEAKPEPESLPF